MPHDIVCFSHLRWDFVFQRPNHLMSRAARDRRVYYVEEPVVRDGEIALALRTVDGVHVVTPQVPPELPGPELEAALARLMDGLLREQAIERPVLWYYTPMALPWTQHLPSAAVVYDCMDHLAGFRHAPAGLERLEQRLVARADLLMTGGARLHAAKSRSHRDAHCFPSSVDTAHFGRARSWPEEPPEQRSIPRPRIGYLGVIDERIDLDLIADLVDADPEWQVVLIGPTAKIDPADLPRGARIHHLGPRSYQELPAYLAGWDLGIMPFAHNDATSHISPTKTPEYLAAGLRVASTSIHDVVEPYGRQGLVHIGDGPDGFVRACREALATPLAGHRERADAFLARLSWDSTWSEMDQLLRRAITRRPMVLHRNGYLPAPAPVRAEHRQVDPARLRSGSASRPAPRQGGKSRSGALLARFAGEAVAEEA